MKCDLRSFVLGFGAAMIIAYILWWNLIGSGLAAFMR